MTEFIVAEISKNWPDPAAQTPKDYLCGQFEEVIEANRRRGYELHSWSFNRIILPGAVLNETVVAVFRRRALQPVPPVNTTAIKWSDT